jgi:uncharacterized protein (DUF488 family)
MKRAIFTIGHSRHPADYFLELLQSQKINCVVDVRSIAASRFNPQYNKPRLSEFLANNGIQYFHLHEEFGARQKDISLLDEIGRVDFEKMRSSEKFKSGISFLKNQSSQGKTIALMCAEADPLNCHRFSMIVPALKKEFQILHVLKDKTVLENEELENKLLKKFRKQLPAISLFDLDETERLQQAYLLMNKRIGYRLG